MDRRMKFILIGKCLDRYEEILNKNRDFAALSDFRKSRFDHFIDLDVSKVDVARLAEADDGTFVHDIVGIFENIQRNPDDPESSELGNCFVPRVGFAA